MIKQPNTIYYVTILDCDDFKKINDAHGHLVGDEVLTKITHEIIKQLTRNSRLYRYGGEEFVIISKNETKTAVYEMMEEIRKSIMLTQLSNDLKVTVSIGIADGSLYKEATFKQADKNLYQSKKTGKNKITIS